jgi:hypothetical protein
MVEAVMTDHHARIRDELDRSHGHLKRWHEQNPGVLSNPDTYLHAFGRITEEQAKDLKAAGVPLSASPTASEIHDAHLHMRTHAPNRVRSAEQLIGHVARRLTPRDEDGRFAPGRGKG